MSEDKILLKVENLHTYFITETGTVPSVNGVSFEMNEGETVAIVGESGSGKSVTSLSIMGLIESPGKIVNGKIKFKDKELNKLQEKEYRHLRGNEIAMIFQEPLTSLNPLFTVGNQISETIVLHQKIDKKTARKQSIEMLRHVGIPSPEKVYDSYPHVLSGGMRQRVMIAMALSCRPYLLIADEPTTALDVTIQAQILNLMRNLSKKHGTSILLITHDLGVVAEMADKVIVMYAGQVVEYTDVFTLFREPKHPYTKGLLNSTPKFFETDEKLESIEGTVPTINDMPKGCKFHPRCPYAMEKCVVEEPQIMTRFPGHQIRCWLYEEGGN
ncbi:MULTISPECIES: ABC transporter ATP-binding protein [unclassified Rummeliibacillus]|mgnify:CR=1 FL=1|uniref:ABC transporter ATP-binding protein n=1 Tax=unclassified Rummeliibacillus TaxID=2622809 RepID=UPI000E66240F|nr:MULTISPECIES: ABC transporter ATP-binding protein [unclassified Rummeliibacillus]RIJ63408.1 ABC transporter ATP-binding protein [Rummeliibacillus sp. POC4]RPJ94169.1 ABC transporter ATP-binding protein [Rummeliibacillus sp. TYF005]